MVDTAARVGDDARESKEYVSRHFVNELGNNISIRLAGADAEGLRGVLIEMDGPRSASSNWITRIEAEKLHEAIGAFLASIPTPTGRAEALEARGLTEKQMRSLSDAIHEVGQFLMGCPRNVPDRERARKSYNILQALRSELKSAPTQAVTVDDARIALARDAIKNITIGAWYPGDIPIGDKAEEIARAALIAAFPQRRE